ncbi:ferritin-like domain-containing protein [Sphingomonas sp. AR_OL41]|uniref:ferritin-like domain-containing protein n=1 Tax=Sphingomonas sp. AR_OL41 TaxID=3042729 RepID=UPI00247FD709|nr:ferritin-like domain-containing protein [Sphingomonas sp. AR_OL41]MDH7975021.1 ferritin-like domain-containing protein [Sphingomonas sp. AR_OL41]
MSDQETLLRVLDASERRREERRNFLRSAGSATIAAGGLALLAGCGSNDAATPTPTPATPTPTPSTAVQDFDILNFALNLEYLEAQFYSFAVYGTGLPASQLTGQGTQGTVTGGKQVPFTDPIVAQYAREIAADEIAHVAFLRSVLGSVAVAQPAINIDGSATGAFTAAARAAGVVGATGTFDPYASDENFLLGAFIFEDVGVTAYKGAAPLITNKTYLEAAAGILAAEAYHAGLVRTTLYRKGMTTPSLVTAAGQISDARDSLDGPTDDDQGISGDATTSNIVPTDANGIAFSRSAGQVLNIVYLSKAALVGGGFFPSGVNGFIKTSAASG